MQSRFGRYALLFVLLLLVGSSLSLIPLFAQDNETILTIAVDQWQADYFDEEVFAAFEEANPGVKVVIVTLDDEARWFGTPVDAEAESINEFIEKLSAYAGEADLLPMNMPGTSSLFTRAGAFLDISPLMNADADANIEDFYPVMLQSFQWDGGTWGLPISGSLNLLAYNKTAFDDANLAYPDENWTLQDWMNAGRALTVYDDEGNVEVPGLFGFDDAMLLRAEYGRSILDPNAFNTLPMLDDPELASLVETWAAFVKETNPAECCEFDWNAVPITSGGVYYLDPGMMMGNGDAEWGVTFYPGGTAGLYVQGYGISAGTENPQEAYELLQYMTTSPELGAFFFGDVTARQSLMGVEVEDSMFMRPELSEEAQAMVAQGIENAIPAPEIEAFRYVQQAVWTVNDTEAEEPLDAQGALLKAQEDAALIYAAVDEAATSSIVTVATPVPTPVLSSDQIALNFGSEMWYGPGSGDELWDAAIADFVAQDPEVGHIEISGEYLQLSERAAEQDCFYLGYNMVQQADLSLILSLDPYLSADPNFNPDEMVVGTMDEVTRDGMIWGMPMSLTPLVMWYEPTLFEEANLPMPENDWTVSQWEDAMRTLYNGDDAVFQTQNWGGNYILMLAAAYGGVPMDFTTTPYTILADDAAINGVREVLDLAKEGLIEYQELVSNSGGMYSNTVAMFDSMLMTNDWRLSNREGEFGDPYRVVMFPSGSNYTPVSYNLATAYISAQSPAADACYRWLSFLSQRPELLGGMPARTNAFEASLDFIQDGQDVVQLYRDFDEALRSGNAYVLPQAYGGATDTIAQSMSNQVATLWLYRAFDNYVLEDGDLAAEMQQGQAFQADYATCISGIPNRSFEEFNEDNQDEFTDYYFQFVECAVAVDPELRDYFQWAYEQQESGTGGGGGGGGGGGD
jgi:ABC-type glycerol-3-phosphate transport system substrate-binding protein